ncbi:polyadenylate-binding protein 2-B [Caerostris darwini]|uniref:Polyadenylate-binding protein 2-B n=1 Tax=Caerostris darwini TaxID=1538125 RepID=A0AAV4TM91_9ARAC|nr:polyadenylate-binding protein 2-B [Caerostris darwini]
MKMMIYKIHMLRVLAVFVSFLTLVSVLIFFNPPQKCIQVSVSVQQWHPYLVKRTRAVQALDEPSPKPRPNFIVSAAKVKINTDAFFRTRLVHRDSDDVEDQDETENEEIDDDIGDVYDEDDTDYLDDLPENKVFEDGDFDYNETKHSDISVITQMFDAYKNVANVSTSLKVFYYSSQNSVYVNVTSISQHPHKRLKDKWRNITLINIEGVPIVEDRIFWSDELEKRSPKGLADAEAQAALQKLRSSKVKRVEAPTWNRCGRPKNQFVVFDDNSKACARYRAPHQYLVQGEVLSFYLARLLGITNVPAVALSAVKDFQGQWNKENVKNLLESKWEANTTVALIQWIENLERDKLPSLLLSSLMSDDVLSANRGELLSLPVTKLVELLQWSDLIIFDYITGNYDRVASMQDAADKEKKPSIMQETIHNLVRSKSDGALWLIDNESGLLDSYSLLYGPAGQDGRFLAFHQQMLKTNCLFRRSTVERVQWLHQTQQAGRILLDLVGQLEPLFTPIERVEEISKRLQDRIAEHTLIMADELTEDVLASVDNGIPDSDDLNISNQTDEMDDPDLEMIKARVKEMEEEAEKIKQMQNEVEKMAHSTPGLLALTPEEKMEIDSRSIYVGNVDYGATAEELEQHFHGCGSINRVTILLDKFTGHPKGFAYIEFADKDSVSTSTALDESLFRGRQIRVVPKRTNRPGISTTNRPPRGRFRRSTRPSYYGGGGGGGYRPMRRSFRRRSWYYPY